MNKQTEALKLALKLALKNAHPSFMTLGWILVRNEDIAAIREALAEQQAQQQEPVAVMTVLHLKDRTEIGYGPASAGYDLPTGEYKLYTSPPASKPWVGLTEQEHTDIAIQCGCMSADWVFYGATVERILKEKNS